MQDGAAALRGAIASGATQNSAGTSPFRASQAGVVDLSSHSFCRAGVAATPSGDGAEPCIEPCTVAPVPPHHAFDPLQMVLASGHSVADSSPHGACQAGSAANARGTAVEPCTAPAQPLRPLQTSRADSLPAVPVLAHAAPSGDRTALAPSPFAMAGAAPAPMSWRASLPDGSDGSAVFAETEVPVESGSAVAGVAGASAGAAAGAGMLGFVHPKPKGERGALGPVAGAGAGSGQTLQERGGPEELPGGLAAALVEQTLRAMPRRPDAVSHIQCAACRVAVCS